MTSFSDQYWRSADGLTLHYRDYPGRDDRPPLLCLPGLTRNARDFEALAARLSVPDGGGWRVLCPEMRGRGLSQYADDAMTYTAPHYVADVLALIEQARIARFVAVGTSLGGLMTMALGMICPERIAGAVLNDIGPVIEAEGLVKIGSYVGADPRFANWDEAASALRTAFASAFPQRAEADWLASARRLLVAEGAAIRFDYDPRIAEPFGAAPAPLPDLWPGLEALAGVPVLVVRGALSDILSAATLAEMQRRLPAAEALTLPGVGHASDLTEPEALLAIDRLLARVA